MKRIILDKIWYATLVSVLGFSACSKDIALGTDPYAGGKESLGVGFYTNYANPEIAKPGELVDFYVKGIKPYLGKINFSVNDTKVEVITAKDSLVTIKVPTEISSGNAKIEVDGQVFYGPRLDIEGNASLDENYGMVNGFLFSVNDILPNAGGYIVTGSFINFENEAVDKKVFRNGIHFIDANGKSATTMTFGEGASGGGSINAVTKMTDGKFVIGGPFGTFNKRRVNNIAKLNTDGKLDTMIVDVVNTTDNPRNSRDTVSAFNGGILGNAPLKVFAVSDNMVVAVGNFKDYYKIDYTYSSRDNRRYLLTEAKNVIRMKADGSLDSTFAFKNQGANGNIMDAALIDNDRVVIVGAFTSYNGKAVPGIACIKKDGTLDPSFNLGGTIDRILKITYNEQLKKIAIAGVFKGLGANGKVNGAAILNTDGTIDDQFVFQNAGNGIPTFAQVLNNGRVIIDGTIESYNNVRRTNMLILEKDGSLLQKYNSQAPFSGNIRKVVETKSSLGLPALLIGGSINQYGKKSVGNFFRLEVKE
ncbi:DUF5008 domain-containing protein [Sphingobacterium sp. ML3W]|uniref:DUF5008 domain-containing protein n=1 Tax=Sphingobacterium sp. ML3W TaxID=1538644 RepID=UPI00249CAD1B|nr:DUF5008 domain-containing protein [Sphingobacterium sp. ML3W]WFA78086.1 DUF5008 domain-containing protein [Sphingobacterium sp. ML3W]